MKSMSTEDGHGLSQAAAKLCQLHEVEQIHRLNINPSHRNCSDCYNGAILPGWELMAEFSSGLLSTFDKRSENMDNYMFCLEGFPSG